MTRLTQRLLIVAATAGVLATSAVAWAHADGHRMDDGPRAERMQKKMAQHQERLKATLQLTPAQESAWKQYTAALQGQTHERPRLDRTAWDKLTTPERMDKMLALRTEREARMRQHIEATKTFYAALTPQQQQVFDQQHAKHGRPGKGHEQGHPHGNHHGKHTNPTCE